MIPSGFSEHLFWSYNKNKDLPPEVIARDIILYGEIRDMILLKKIINRSIINKVLEDLSKRRVNAKRIFFIRKIILPD